MWITALKFSITNPTSSIIDLNRMDRMTEITILCWHVTNCYTSLTNNVGLCPCTTRNNIIVFSRLDLQIHCAPVQWSRAQDACRIPPQYVYYMADPPPEPAQSTPTSGPGSLSFLDLDFSADYEPTPTYTSPKGCHRCTGSCALGPIY